MEMKGSDVSDCISKEIATGKVITVEEKKRKGGMGVLKKKKMIFEPKHL